VKRVRPRRPWLSNTVLLGQLELAPGNDDRAAADLHQLDLVCGALGLRVEGRWAADLGALRDLDLIAPADLAVAREVHRQRPRGRAGRRVLRDPAESEHARLPALPRAGEAVRSERARQPKHAQVRVKASDL